MITDPRIRSFHSVVRVQWPHPAPAAPAGAEKFIGNTLGQATVWRSPPCVLTRGIKDRPDSPVLVCDFGQELHGGVQLVVANVSKKRPAMIRVTFGESVAEALGTPDQDHAIHQHTVQVPWQGVHEVGSTGFRYVRIDLPEDDTEIELHNIRAVSLGFNTPRVGSFECSDVRLNQIWTVGAYTLHLCMQEHLWDGIKRDRLIWAGDMNPEVLAVLALYGSHPIVPSSLDFVRDETPLPKGWMNHMPTYSLWWIITWRDWWFHTGDQSAIENNRHYIVELLDAVVACLGEDGSERLPARFLDWPTAGDKTALAVGAHALLRLALQAGAELCQVLGDTSKASCCFDAARRMVHFKSPSTANQQANALRVLAGLSDPTETNQAIFKPDPTKNLSPFYGYYVLEARAAAGDYAGCLDLIRRYWGGMLDFGGTTFWEHFDMAWVTHDPPYVGINDWPVKGRPNLHEETGDHCYKGFRHSLCHGWSSGPTVWLGRHVLGVNPTAPGYSRVSITPQLADLRWARGTVPTPYGPITVSHVRAADGTIQSEVDLPDGISRDKTTTNSAENLNR